MALPKLQHPIYSTTLPSTGKKINYRGFLSKEQKILLLAVQSQDPQQQTMALKQILTNCIIDKINVDKLIMPDVEWLYLQIVTKSLGEELDLIITCANCQEDVNYKLQLNGIALPKITKNTTTIKLDENTFITLKYPTLNTIEDIDIINETIKIETTEDIINSISRNVESITSGEETFDIKDQTPDEIFEFFDSMDATQLALITNFFADIPTIEEKIQFTCKCGHYNEYSIRGLSQLFL